MKEFDNDNYCALKSISDDQVKKVIRAFWRRIYPYRNDYGIELPNPLPVEFMAHMATALSWVDRDLSGDPDSWRITSKRFCGTHTTDKDIADYYADLGECYPLYKKPMLPSINGVSIDADSPNGSGVLISFERKLTDEEIRSLHEFLQ